MTCKYGVSGVSRVFLFSISVLGIILAVFSFLAPARAFSNGKVNFKVKIKDEVIPYRVMSVFVLPGERMELEVQKQQSKLPPVVQASGGEVLKIKGGGKWEWHAPEHPSLYKLVIRYAGDCMVINAFVMIPYKELKGGYLNGYRIGNYPPYSAKLPSIYKPPKGFVEVTRENSETFVTPHYKLGQFACKEGRRFPKYIVLRPRLLLKLEYLSEKVNLAGYRCNSFHIMCGYRTPYYNKLIGDVKYSRHQWGGAADIFIDSNPAKGMMEDLNKDGKIDFKDACVLYRIIDAQYGKPGYRPFIGGLGRYHGNHFHGPFVHVDVRGKRARWG